MNKIFNFAQLPRLVKQLKQSGQQVVLVGGCFDILHLGHIRFLNEAKKYGTVIVVLESDKALRRHKGHLRPIHKQADRAEVLSALETVDYIILLPYLAAHANYFKLVKTISPHVIVVTVGDPLLDNKRAQAQAVGAKIVSIPKIATPSTTQLAKLLGLE